MSENKLCGLLGLTCYQKAGERIFVRTNKKSLAERGPKSNRTNIPRGTCKIEKGDGKIISLFSKEGGGRRDSELKVLSPIWLETG